MVASSDSSSSVGMITALTLPLTEMYVLLARTEAWSMICGRLVLAWEMDITFMVSIVHNFVQLSRMFIVCNYLV